MGYTKPMKTENLKCEICGKRYIAKYNGYGYRTTCSKKCQSIKYKATCSKKNNKPQRRCLVCGSIFRIYKAHLRRNRGIYCSRKCRWSYKYDEKKRWDANNYIAKKLRQGKLKRPDKCSVCGNHNMIEAHHPLGYEKEHWDTIKWLCRKCHNNEHERLRRS